MAATGNGTSSALSTASGLTGSALASITVHAWIRNAAVPGTAVVDRPWGVVSTGVDANDYFFAFSWDHTTAGRVAALVANDSADSGNAKVAQLTTSLLADTWYAIGGTYDGTNIKAWLNGVAEATTAVGALDTTANPKASILSSRGGETDFDNSTIAEFAIWSDDLAQADLTALAAGVSPAMVRPDLLVLYWPLIRDFLPRRGPAPVLPTGLGQTTPTVGNHPRVIYPANGSQFTEVALFKRQRRRMVSLPTQEAVQAVIEGRVNRWGWMPYTAPAPARMIRRRRVLARHPIEALGGGLGGLGGSTVRRPTFRTGLSAETDITPTIPPGDGVGVGIRMRNRIDQ